MKTKQIIIINSIMLIIALYTFISLCNPSLLSFMDSNYVDGKYIGSGGDHFMGELFLGLMHYFNLFVFFISNIVIIIWSYRKQYYKNIAVSIIFIFLILGIQVWTNSTINNNTIQIEEHHN